MDHIDGKVIVITGAASGFGRLIAEATAGRGAAVVCADRDGDGASAVAAGIVGRGGKATARTADVTQLTQLQTVVSDAVDEFGAVDVWINNAGVMPLAFFADHDRAHAAWVACIDVNLTGVLNGICAVHDQMIAQGRGHIVNISSIYGNVATVGSAVYTATKAAVNVLSEALRAESQGAIKVTVVKPTGVPGTGLGSSIINGDAIVGILGQNADRFAEHAGAVFSADPPTELTDPESIRQWAVSPEELARHVVYAIDQPWGVSVSDITIRATGEDYLF